MIDDDYEDGISAALSHKIMKDVPSKFVDTLGLDNRTAGFSKHTDNLPPDANKIIKKIKELIK